MYSAELHLMREVAKTDAGVATIFFGARYMQINESFKSETVTEPMMIRNHIFAGVDNHLVGSQLGLVVESAGFGGIVNITLKSSLPHNYVDKMTRYQRTGSGNDLDVFGLGDASSASLRGELGIEYLFSMTPNCFIRAGYQVMDMTGIALAPENSERSLAVLESGLAKVDANGKVVYQLPQWR